MECLRKRMNGLEMLVWFEISFEECVANQANRIVKINELTKDVLVTLTEPDIPPVKESIEKYLEFGEVK
jgi:hypothetical protein